MGSLPLLLAVLLLQGPPASPAGSPSEGREQQAQRQPAQPGQQSPEQAPGRQQPAQQPPKPQAPPPAPAQPPARADDPFSIDRLREDLQRKPTITFVVPDPNLPRFKVEVEAKRWELPDLKTRMANAIPKMPVQVPFGGTLASDMARLNTPAEFFGSAPFTNGDLLKMEALSGAYGLAGALIKRAILARQDAEAAQIREQIRQELAAIDEHNARVAAGLTDDGPDPKRADKPKKPPEKKPPVKKKK